MQRMQRMHYRKRQRPGSGLSIEDRCAERKENDTHSNELMLRAT